MSNPKNKKSRNAQAQTEIFVYVLGAIIFTLVLAYGYKSINELRQKGEIVELLKAKADLEAKINSIKTEFGSVRKHEMYIPSSFQKICFVDLQQAPLIKANPSSINSLSAESKDAASVVSSWQPASAISQNVFLVPSSPVEISLSNMKIETPYWFCSAITQGRVTLRLEGQGKYVKVSKWQ